jgi:pimeloyl-ACP methyl ester carboxylesterase
VDDLRMVDTGGARLACRVAGDDAAPALVLLHALGEDGSTWAGTARRLPGRYQVYAPDLRGHSDRCREYSFAGRGLPRLIRSGHREQVRAATAGQLPRPPRVR